MHAIHAFYLRIVYLRMAGVSIFPFHTIESPIPRAFSSGFSVGASLSGENLFDGNGRAVFSVAQW